MKIHLRLISLPAAMIAATLVATPITLAHVPGPARSEAGPSETERPRASNKWRIVFDERAKSSGTISFGFWPNVGAPFQVDVAIAEGQSENQIAATVRNALRRRLGEAIHVEVDDGEDVLLKARHGTDAFGLQLLGNSARDVEIRLRRE